MVVWAGNSPEGPAGGATYNPDTNRWRRLPNGPLGPREGYVSAWTGRELLILGGHTGQVATPTAATVNPRTGAWRELRSLKDVRSLASAQGAVWDGHEALVSGNGTLFAVNPVADTARAISLAPAPIDSRQRSHLNPIAWTGREVIFWAQAEMSSPIGVVGYNPATGRWKKTGAAPCAGSSQVAWVGNRLIAACGTYGLQIYAPATNSWSTVRSGRSPLNSREQSAIAWSGTDLIVWSGAVHEPGNPTPAEGASITLED